MTIFSEVTEQSVTEVQIVKEVTLATSSEEIVDEKTDSQSEEVRDDEKSVREDSDEDKVRWVDWFSRTESLLLNMWPCCKYFTSENNEIEKYKPMQEDRSVLKIIVTCKN